MRAGVGATSVAVAALLGTLVVLAHSHDWLRSGIGAHAGWLARGRRFAADWARGLDTLRSWRRAAVALAYSLGAKAIEVLAIIAVQRAFGISLSLGGSLLVLASVMLATMFPVAPANLGTYEASAAFVYPCSRPHSLSKRWPLRSSSTFVSGPGHGRRWSRVGSAQAENGRERSGSVGSLSPEPLDEMRFLHCSDVHVTQDYCQSFRRPYDNWAGVEQSRCSSTPSVGARVPIGRQRRRSVRSLLT